MKVEKHHVDWFKCFNRHDIAAILKSNNNIFKNLFMFLNNYIISCLRMIFNQYFSFKEFRKMPLLKYDEGNETIHQNQNCNFKVARKVA